jgi:hypothetical protein
MTYFAYEARTEDSPILHAAIGLAKDIRGAGDEIEMGRRIPRSIAASGAIRKTYTHSELYCK